MQGDERYFQLKTKYEEGNGSTGFIPKIATICKGLFKEHLPGT